MHTRTPLLYTAVDVRPVPGYPFRSHSAVAVPAAVVGYLTTRLFLLPFLANHTLRIFAYYRFALTAVVASVLLFSGS